MSAQIIDFATARDWLRGFRETPPAIGFDPPLVTKPGGPTPLAREILAYLRNKEKLS